MEIDKLEGRLIIEKVTLRNFKSYAGEKIIGPFHKSLTSVVGPNGSGKSNLLESLLFAFGKRARKMRLKRLSELIHHSQEHPNLTEASVEVHFQNIIDSEDSFSVVPGSKLILTRIVHKNNTSEYKLDNRGSTFEEVTKTLKIRGIDLEHNRFLILQGEVEQIAMMKPRAPINDENKSGLLEYLEEIIGTDQYVPDIEKAEKQLETLGDDVASKKVRFEEAKKTVDQLDAPMKEALAYIELEKESLEFKCLKCRLEHFNKAIAVEEVTQEISLQGQKLVELEEKFGQKREENKKAIVEYEKRMKEAREVKKNHEKIFKELQNVITHDGELTEEVKKVKASISQNEKDKEISMKRCEEVKNSMETISSQIPDLDRYMQVLKTHRIEKEHEFQTKEIEVKQITETLQREKHAVDQELKPLKREFTTTKAEKDSKAQKVQLLTQELQSGDSEKQKIQQSLKEIHSELAEKSSELDQFTQISLRQCEILKNSGQHLESINQKIEGVQRDYHDLQQKIQIFEREEKKMFENKGRFSEVYRAKMEKRLTGIHGRLGDLGQINPIYDSAVSSAFAGLDNLVVDTIRESNELFDFAREKGLGKLNVICLEKVHTDVGRMNNFRDKNVLRLFDQIKFSDDRIKPAFYLVFGDTLFTETIEEARSLAFGAIRRKVVTKDGNIINPTGEMRGFAQPTRGKMKLIGTHSAAVVEGDIQQFKRDAKQATDALELLNQEKIKLQSAIVNEKTNERQNKQKVKLLENEISERTERIKSLEDRLIVVNNRSIENIQTEIKMLQTLIEKSETNLKKLEMLIEQKNKKIHEIENKIDEAAGNDFKALRQTLKKLLEDEEKAEKDLMKAESTLAQRRKDLEKYSVKLNQIDEELLSFKNRYEELLKLRSETRIKADTLAANLKELEENMQEQDKLMKVLQEQQEFMKKEFDEILRCRDEVKQVKKDLQARLKVLETELQRWETKLESALNDFENLTQEYSGLLEGVEMETPVVNPEHQSKRSKINEERVSLRKPVDWQATREDLYQFVSKLKIIEEIESAIEQELSNRPNLKVIEDYKSRLLEKKEKEDILNDAKLQENELKALYTDYKNKRLTEFTKGFREISDQLRNMYKTLTNGGNAELELADSTDPFSEGIIFTVRPPSKSWKKMANLSGGEKTLSSLALVFALHHYKPNCLYVMDEVDAALDFQNVSVIANYIKGQTKTAQFIVVSLRYQMFEVADQLVGIYKTRDVSKSLCICPYSLTKVKDQNPIIMQTLNNIGRISE